jgi:D-glucuronyl C5-epimerase C-terminus
VSLVRRSSFVAAIATGALVAGCSVIRGKDAVTAQAPRIFTFNTHGFGLYDIPRESYPYALNSPVDRIDTGTHDPSEVRMALVNGKLYDHPVGQATYGLANLESYRITNDSFYLRRAEQQAGRLISRAVVAGGAWYVPYPFSFDLHGLVSQRIYEPWYSAMAQGQILSLLVRLAETTGDARYRAAADGVFATYLRPSTTSRPWTVWVDRGGYLWLEEYAGPHPDRTYNGQMFAAWGLWDYWRLTGDARARHLWDGALTTVVAYAPTIRNAGWLSSYCLSHQWAIAETYHLIHISQLATMYSMTHNPALAQYSEAFMDDYPPPGVAGAVRFGAGHCVGYKFTYAGAVVARRTTTFSHPASAPADLRTRIKGRSGMWYRITAGVLGGYYVQERPRTVVLGGMYLPLEWNPTRTGLLAAGRAVIGYEFAADGAVTGSRRVTPSAVTSFGVSRTAHWNAARHALAVNGPLAGLWVPLAAVTFA